MKKQLSKILALAIVAIMCVSMAAPVFALPGMTTGEGEDAKQVSTYVYFDKDLIMPKDATVPDVSFSFTLVKNGENKKDTGKIGTIDGWDVYEGIFDGKWTTSEDVPESDGEKVDVEHVGPSYEKEDGTTVVFLPTSYTVEFDASHPTTPGQYPSGTKKLDLEDPKASGILATVDEKYATESFEVDFQYVNYTAPGIYRYKITEDKPTEDGISQVGVYSKTDDEEKSIEKGAEVKGTYVTYYIDVYVVATYNEEGEQELVIGDIIVTDEDRLTTDSENDADGDGLIDEFPEEEPDPDPTKPNPTVPGKLPAGGEGDKDTEEPGEGEKNDEDKIPDEDPSDDDDDEKDPDGPDVDPNPDVNKGQSKADFINRYEPLTLTLTKVVTGNQGSHDQYFVFEIDFDLKKVDDPKDEEGTKVTISDGVYKIVDTDSNSGSAGYLVVKNGVGQATVNVKHHNTITILVPYKTQYTITETAVKDYKTAATTEEATADELAGWTPADWTKEENASKLGLSINNEADENGMSESVDVTFVNHKEGTLPTGIMMAIAPFAALMGVGLVGGAVVLGKKRK